MPSGGADDASDCQDAAPTIPMPLRMPLTGTDSPELHIWKNGRITSVSDAVVSVWDHGFLYGDGVFEGIRVRSRHLFRIRDHLERLRRSAHILQITLPFSDHQLIAAISDLLDANSLTDAHLRVILTRGPGVPSLDPRLCAASTTLILGYPLQPTLGTEPVSLITSSVVRKSPRSADPQLKSLSYVDSLLARLQAISAGADDALLLDGEGFIAEATGANVFAVASGRLSTPACTSALAGITRRTVLEMAEHSGISFDVRRITLGDFYAADEAFLTGTGAGIVPIRQLDGRQISHAPGEITQMMMRLYEESWSNASHATRV